VVNISGPLIEFLSSKNRRLDLQLKQANIKESVDSYIKKSALIAFVLSFIISAPFFFVFLKEKISMLYWILVLAGSFYLGYHIMLGLPYYSIKKRTQEIESDLLYSVRYLLLKMRTGSPLLNALADVARLKTNSSRYFGEIIGDIYRGDTVENSINNAYLYTPSKQFKEVLRVIRESLSTGVDVKNNLEVLLRQMTREQLIKIESYSKKISSLSMFYMVLGVIAPSLGVSVFIIGASFVNIKVTGTLLGLIFMPIAGLQMLFIYIFKSIKPMVNL